jgi:hypothetical protein
VKQFSALKPFAIRFFVNFDQCLQICHQSTAQVSEACDTADRKPRKTGLKRGPWGYLFANHIIKHYLWHEAAKDFPAVSLLI